MKELLQQILALHNVGTESVECNCQHGEECVDPVTKKSRESLRKRFDEASASLRWL
ncbi:MAG: hypothetical protein ACI9SY_000675 [Candidatus Paceibacteria bacterium]|jgi:hypothetical protein